MAYVGSLSATCLDILLVPYLGVKRSVFDLYNTTRKRRPHLHRCAKQFVCLFPNFLVNSGPVFNFVTFNSHLLVS